MNATPPRDQHLSAFNWFQPPSLTLQQRIGKAETANAPAILSMSWGGFACASTVVICSHVNLGASLNTNQPWDDLRLLLKSPIHLHCTPKTRRHGIFPLRNTTRGTLNSLSNHKQCTRRTTRRCIDDNGPGSGSWKQQWRSSRGDWSLSIAVTAAFTSPPDYFERRSYSGNAGTSEAHHSRVVYRHLNCVVPGRFSRHLFHKRTPRQLHAACQCQRIWDAEPRRHGRW